MAFAESHGSAKLKCFAEGFVRCCEEGDFEAIPDEEPHVPEKRALY